MNSHQATRMTQFKNDMIHLKHSANIFRKLQEAIWLTVINKIFEFLPHLVHLNYLYKLF